MIDSRLPSFPARPIHGPRLDTAAGRSMASIHRLLDASLYGDRAAEPKWNGFRLLFDRVDFIPWNRHGGILDSSQDVYQALQWLHDLPNSFPRYVDCEMLSRRHGFMKGCLIALDVLETGEAGNKSRDYPWRRKHMEEHIELFEPTKHLLQTNTVCLTPSVPLENTLLYWDMLKEFNKSIGTTGLNSFFEGVVLKQLDSPYPTQRISPERETPLWTKHRFV
jgi:hypothetical protein